LCVYELYNMAENKILDAIKKARETDKKRNFKQSFDLAINLKNIDMKKPESKIKTEVKMPHGIGKEGKIGIIADTLASKAGDMKNVIVINKAQLDNFSKNKKEAKKMVKQCRYFLAEVSLMPTVGKILGPILAPKNLMPNPIPANVNLASIIEEKTDVFKIQLKDSPTIHIPVGVEDMEDQKIAENIDTVIKAVIAKLPKGREQVKNFVVKLTMGKPSKFKM
jgi:large subunit ribosomal protein L1